MAAGALAVVLPAAASRRGFFPLCLILPLLGSVTFLAFVPQLVSWRPCRSHSLFPSLAPSWRWLCPLLWWALLTLSGYVLSVPSAVFFVSVSLIYPVSLSPLLHHSPLLTVSVIGARFAYAVGRLTMRLVPLVPLGSCGGSTYIALHWTWLVSADLPCGLGAQVGVSSFHVRHSARLHGDHFVSFPDSCVSLPRISHRVHFLGRLTRRVTGLTLCPPPRSSRILSFARTYSADSLSCCILR